MVYGQFARIYLNNGSYELQLEESEINDINFEDLLAENTIATTEC